jgi:hypothetical protein
MVGNMDKQISEASASPERDKLFKDCLVNRISRNGAR